MLTPQAYLSQEFHRYYPESNVLVRIWPDGETIDVVVTLDADVLEGESQIKYRSEAGSDDDYFVFKSLTFLGRQITIPFQPDEPARSGCGVHPILSGKEG